MIAERFRRWMLPALACAGMLILPALVWLIVPRPPVFLPAPATRTEIVAVTPSGEPSPRAAARPVRPAHAGSPGVPSEPGATGPVQGVVLDPDGHPTAKASVGCDEHDPPLTTTTDDEGRFELAAEAAGCLATAHHPDFVGSERVALVAGAANTLRLTRGGAIEGDVVDEHGAPVTPYLLTVESYQGPQTDGAPTGQVKNVDDPRGAFRWDKLVAGHYVLTASADGRPPVRSQPVDVDVGRTTAHVRITLPHGATLSGRILDAATRKPIVGARVLLDAFTAARAQGSRPAHSDEQGAYVLEGAPAGPFSIRVTRDGYRPRTLTGLTTRGAPTLQQDVELNALVDGGPTGEDFAGIGAFLAPTAKGVTFSRLIPDGPAEKAGIQVGDLIHRIDGRDASALPLFECMQSLRGPDGSRVTVQVEREGRPVDFTIQRRSLTL